MAYRVDWTARARHDVESIIRYISGVVDSPQAAAEHLDAFLSAVDVLEENPHLYAVSTLPPLKRRALRPCFVKNHVMLFSIDGDAVMIYRVFHQRQNYAKLI